MRTWAGMLVVGVGWLGVGASVGGAAGPGAA